MIPAPHSAPPPRKLSAAVLRAFAANIQAKGLTESLRAKLSPQTFALIVNPPLPTEWIDSHLVYEVYDAVGKIGGPGAVRQMGYEAMRDALGNVLKPIVDVTMAIHGRTPEGLLSHFDRIGATFLRDIAVSYTATSPTSGTIEIRYETPVPAPVFPVWGGVFSFFVELTGVNGVVSDCEPFDHGTRGRMSVRW